MQRKRKPDLKADYMPLHESDVKHSLEVDVKEKPKLKDLIKIEKQGKLKSKTDKKKTRKTSKSAGKYILILTEKPQAADKIASSLGNPKRYYENRVSYYELEKNGKKIMIACAVGHLFNLDTDKKGWPVFDIYWKPSYQKSAKWTKKYFNVLKKLVKNASEFILATDYDVEGEVIGWNILRFIAKQNDCKRMKFSTLTKSEIENSFINLQPTINWGHAIAGETRHFLDWMYGVNFSKALIETIKKAGRFKILSIGRVQGPTLNLIVNKELEIQKFKPQPYWQIFIKLKNHSPKLQYEKNITKKSDLNKFKNLKGEKGQAKTKKTKKQLPPPAPFDLTTLQREAYRVINTTPSQTLQIAQNLYLKGVISYPRTSSQKIPESISPQLILKKLSSQFKETKLAIRKKPVQGKKSDPAHPSIYPTGEFQNLIDKDRKLYDLIVKRFISCFCESAEIENKRIEFITNKDHLKFKTSGLEIKKKTWLSIYPAVIKEKELEDISGEKKIEKSEIQEKETKPPKRFTPASIVTELEKRNLGTKATRSNIIEILYKRDYVRDRQIRATPLGISLIKSLEKYSPIIIDEKLTRKFEKDMEKMQTYKKKLTSLQEKTISEARQTIEKISNDLKKQENKIGKELVKSLENNWEKEKQENTIIECPKCKKGKLRILYNRNAKRYFIGCSNYPNCRNTYTLPPNGLIKTTDKKCESCQFPMLMSIRKGKRPWFFCFNPDCETNESWAKKKKQN